MSLQASIEATLPRLRAEAEARMTSRCSVMRKTGGTTTVGGFKVDEWAAVHVDLPVRIGSSERSRRVDVVGVDYDTPLRVASFPRATEDLRDADLIEITSGDTAGQVFRLIETEPADQQTARRINVVGVARPEEWS